MILKEWSRNKMKLETHIANSLKKCDIAGRDIHEWIDAHFEHDKFKQFIATGILPDGWDPYGHRVHRHCIEALELCQITFRDKYSAEDVEAVFKSHLADDYRGYLPVKADFINLKFHNKYHKF